MADVKLEQTPDDSGANKFSFRDDASDDGTSDDDNEEIIPNQMLPIIEPSPIYLPHMYDTDHLHRHHRRDESTLNIPKGIISSTPAHVINFKF